ncbi:MAG TPA: response regulator transcription factor [Anaerolineales bacterium]|jgi:NarL family two-component system response regulator LiaR|nr:response regulator transcription factor [Anaerolineales bacterium]
MKKVRILVVDDESVVREGVVAILSLQKDLEVVGEGQDGLQAVRLANKTKPDVILLDMVMPNQDGLATIPKLKEILPNGRILVLTSFAESDRVYQAIKSGALGYLLKDATRVQLLQAIRDVASGQASIAPSIAMKVIHEIDHPSELMYTAEPLTPRELETLKLIARGLSNQEIADALFVHERTVAKYVSSILEKLQLANRTQAALYAIREGLTEPQSKIVKTDRKRVN